MKRALLILLTSSCATGGLSIDKDEVQRDFCLIHDQLICYEKEPLKPTVVKVYNLDPLKPNAVDIPKEYKGWIILPADTFKQVIEH